MGTTLHQLVMVFSTTPPKRLQLAGTFVQTLPRLTRGLLAECDLGVRRAGGPFVCTARFRIPVSTQTLGRIRYWCWLAGGTVLSTAESATVRSATEALEFRYFHVNPGMLPGAVRALVEVVSAEQEGIPAETLALPIPLPSDGLRFERDRNGLFIPSPLCPPMGDDVPIRFQPNDGPPIEAGGIVMSIRGAGEEGPGAPAGFVLALVSPTPEVLAAIERHTNKDQGAARRKAPRYRIHAPARVVHRSSRAIDDVRFEYSGSFGDTDEAIENLSQSGAFVRTTQTVPKEMPITLEVLLPGGMLLTISATVVHQDSRGLGLKFEFNPGGEVFLAKVLEEAALRPPRALVVDDDVLARRMIGDALADRGFEIFAAENGLAGLRVLTEVLLDLDLVVIDLHMPVMSGEELLQRIRVAGGERELPVVIVTAFMLDDGGNRLFRAGADAVLSKSMGATLLAEESERVALQKQMGRERAGEKVVPISLYAAG